MRAAINYQCEQIQNLFCLKILSKIYFINSPLFYTINSKFFNFFKTKPNAVSLVSANHEHKLFGIANLDSTLGTHGTFYP